MSFVSRFIFCQNSGKSRRHCKSDNRFHALTDKTTYFQFHMKFLESAFFSEISFRTVYLFQAKLYWLKCVVTWQVQNQSNLLSTKYGEISSKLRTKSFLLSSDLSKAWSRDKFLTNQQVDTDLTFWLLSHNKKPECMRVKRVLSQ